MYSSVHLETANKADRKINLGSNSTQSLVLL